MSGLTLPTSPGSVVDADFGEDGHGPLFLLDRDAVNGALTRFWVDVTGFHWDDDEFELVRVIYDAGSDR